MTASHRGGGASRAAVTAVCCLTPDVVLVGTDSGQLVTYSLNLPVVKNFRSSKSADQKRAWSLAASTVWNKASGAAGANLYVQFLRLSPEHGSGVVLCGLRSGRVVVFDTGAGHALGVTEPHRGASIGYCPAPAAAPVPASACASAPDGGGAGPIEGVAPLAEGEGASDPYAGGHWGPVVLACCKEGDGRGGEELVVLSTSSRAALDSGQQQRGEGGGGDKGTARPRRKSGLRPGRGWEIGAAGGGGFRLEESEGYDLCLPVEVVEATPGRRRVRLSADVRGYVCPRDEGRLLRSGLVTSSIKIGAERHSVEAVSGDGTVLVLDRKYRGPAVAAGPGPGDAARMAVASASSLRHDAAAAAASAASSPDGGGQGAVEDNPCSDEPETGSGGDAGRGTERTTAYSGGDAQGETAAAAVPAEDTATATAASSEQPQPQEEQREPPWDRAWRPSGDRVFAKLRAVFGDERHESEAPPPFALYQVVARAKLDMPVTAITSHPRMNFVLVGLSDGTVAVVLPRG